MPLLHYLCVAKVGLVLVSLPNKTQYLVVMPELILGTRHGMVITCVLQMSWSRCLHVVLDNLNKPRSSCHATSCKEQGVMYNTAYKQFGNILDGLNKDLNCVFYMAHMISAVAELFLS